MKKAILFVLVFVCLNSCKSYTGIENDFNIVKLNIDSYENELVDFIESIEIFPINDTANLINGYPEELLKMDSSFAIVDLQVNNEIYILDFNFNVTQKIAKRGEGPEEYSKIYDIVYNPKRKTFTIMDLNKMIEYGLNGAFKRTVPFTYFPDRLDIFNDNNIIWNNNRPLQNSYFRYYRLSEDYDVVGEQIPFNPYENNFSREPINSVFSNDENIFFTSWMNDTIYSLTKETQKVAKTIIKFENSDVNTILNEKHEYEEELDNTAFNKKVWLWESAVITKDYFLTIALKSGIAKLLIQDNKTGKGYISSANPTISDAFLLMVLKAKNVVEGNSIYYLAEAELLNEFLEICMEKDDFLCSMLKMKNGTQMAINPQFYILKIDLKDENTF